MPDERSISETVSVILIIFMVIVLAIVIMALVFGTTVFQQKSALVVMNISNATYSGKNAFVIFDRGGDEVYLNSSLKGMHRMSINLDNSTSSFTARPVTGLNIVKPGMTLYIYYDSAKKAYLVTTDTSVFTTGAVQTITDCPLKIRLVDEDAHLLLSSWNWDCIPTGAAPANIRINNTPGYRGWPVTENITGINFLPGAGAKFNRTGYPDIPATSCTFRSSSLLVCTFSLLEKNATTYNVVVTNPDTKQGMGINAFVLNSPAPTYTGSSDTTGTQATTVTVTSLRGTYFQPTTTFVYWQGATTIPLTGVTIWNATSASGTLVIPSNAPSGSYNLTIYNTDYRNVTRTGAFTVASNAPTVTSVTPNTGTRGWPVNITGLAGTKFQPGAVVKLVNSTAGPDITATSVAVNAANTSITCTFDLTSAPAGRRNITVTNPDGKTGTLANGFMVTSPAPAFTGISPAAGPIAGGTSVTINGTNLTGATAVTFGGTAATAFTVVSSTQITAITPAHAAGAVNVVITTPGGTATGTGRYTYAAAPTFTIIAPAFGQTAGGTIVTLTGTGFTGATAVTFDGIPATAFTVASATRITATTPAHAAGAVNVVVTAPGGTASRSYTYADVPTFVSIAPAAGPTAGGTSVTITGTNLTGATAVTFGGTAATTFSVVSSNQITAITPAHAAGAVNVVITTPGGTATGTGKYTYAAVPTFTSIAPAFGPTAGGTGVTLTGTGFTGATAVTFDGIPATAFAVASATRITATTPAHTTGTVTVVVTTPGGTATRTYTYANVPAFVSIAPSAGPAAGGTSVTITGTGFTGATAVRFGTTAAPFSVGSDSSITATTPAHGAGAVNVVIITPGGTATGTNRYTYTNPPTVTSIAPATGTAAGGTVVTITGTNFVTGATSVTVDGIPATAFTVVSTTRVTATVPAHAAGTANLAVTTPGGTATRTFMYI